MLSVNLLATAVVGFYASSINAADYETYPTVAHTASINGFADKIYDRLPDCAKSCVQEDTGNTPCPYWDPGCLCVMSNWGGPVAECIADNCQGDNVVTATSLATSICSSAGVPSPFWFIPASASADLLAAAEATVTDDATSSTTIETSDSVTSASATSEPASNEPVSSAPATSEPASNELVSSAPATTDPTSSVPATTDPATSDTAENPYATYPTVVRTASINGFADKLYDQLPECAKPCVEEDTGITPCPYWDPGCLCVMSNWGGEVAECIAENCQGSEVSTATSLANSVCSSAGVPSPYWYLPASASADLLSAAAAATVTTTEASSISASTYSTSSVPATTDHVSSILTNNDPVSSAQVEKSGSDEGAFSSKSSVVAITSDAKHTNDTSTITSTSKATVTDCPSCTKQMTTFNSTQSNGSIITKASGIVTSSDSNGDYTSTSVTSNDSTQVEFSTTVITVTSCQSNKCSDILKTTGVTFITEEHTSYTTYCPLPTESESTVTTIVTSILSCDKSTCKSIPTTIASAIASESKTHSKSSNHESSHITTAEINSVPTSHANEFPSPSSVTLIAENPSNSNSSSNNAYPDTESSGSGHSGSQTISPVSVSNENSFSSISNAVETTSFTPSVFEGIAPVNKQWGLPSFVALFAIALF
ncbi:uncharacterized protein AC631_05699 [Debaryomyces fabryi]|uniref:CFEM domain-containing protein n=1 Tax=Debaryomyces fabryi TaxID=58627 RepID=A0A0V1PQV9_9ASCO|nr:uncharacterized protein AC631_05699 [Debaryomyces fabryi]KRZ98537.1 hypothetical protein AC631_05699 [Debaryomyces fabryi]CUM53038.1 unnamed protein product [Debaryomyces fabryi]